MINGLWSLTYAGRDISERLARVFNQLTLSDTRGHSADTLSISLIDSDAALELPPLGARIGLRLGAKERGLVDKGQFIVDQNESSGPPDKIQISAASADFTKLLKVKREVDYQDQSVADIAKTVAGRHGLRAAIDEVFTSKNTGHITQANESDLNLMNRLAKDYGGFFDIKNQTLIMSEENIAATQTGKAIPTVTLDRSDTVSHRMTERARDNQYTGVRAHWNDTDAGQRVWEQVGDGDQILSLQTTFPNSNKALEAAKAEFERLKRGIKTLSLRLKHGRAEIIPETPVSLSGFKATIRDERWIVTSAHHQLGARTGFLTQIDLETRRD